MPKRAVDHQGWTKLVYFDLRVAGMGVRRQQRVVWWAPRGEGRRRMGGREGCTLAASVRAPERGREGEEEGEGF